LALPRGMDWARSRFGLGACLRLGLLRGHPRRLVFNLCPWWTCTASMGGTSPTSISLQARHPGLARCGARSLRRRGPGVTTLGGWTAGNLRAQVGASVHLFLSLHAFLQYAYAIVFDSTATSRSCTPGGFALPDLSAMAEKPCHCERL